MALKKNRKLGVYMNYKKLNDVTKKYRYSIPYWNKVLEKMGTHELYYIAYGYNEDHQVSTAKED